MHWLSQNRTNGRDNAFAAPSPPRDWHGGPFPTHGELAQGLSLTMRPTRTASPLCFFSPQQPETWLSPAFCANILAHLEVCFQKFGYIYKEMYGRFVGRKNSGCITRWPYYRGGRKAGMHCIKGIGPLSDRDQENAHRAWLMSHKSLLTTQKCGFITIKG